MSFVTIGGVSLHYRHTVAASGADTIVFINSLGTDFRIWDAVVDVLDGATSILCYDKRGHGLSDVGSTPYSMDDHIDDLAGLLDHLGVHEAILCGLSAGGLVAQGFCARHPDRVKGLILCGTAAKVGTTQSWNERIAKVENNGIAAIADGIMKVWFTPDFHRRNAAELAGVKNMLIRQPVAGYVGTCAAVRDADYTADTARIAVPTLVVVGDQDGSTPPDLVRATAERIRAARFEVIAGAGHITCVEQPAALLGLLRDFLARHFLLD